MRGPLVSTRDFLQPSIPHLCAKPEEQLWAKASQKLFHKAALYVRAENN